jgi:glutamate carboxypeptidase
MSEKSANLPKVDAAEILEGINSWVEIESPSYQGETVNRMADLVEDGMRTIGAEIERRPGWDGIGDTLIARTPWGGDEPGILVLSHLDTVHPLGTVDGVLPMSRDGDKVFGPGCYDMKGGAYLGYYAYRHLVRAGKTTPLPITFLYAPDEEVGSHTSRDLIEREARKAKYVLVAEPARDGGKVVTSRKGSADYALSITGRPAHAGANHDKGRSAIREMARQILDIEAMTDYGRGITTNVGVINGGTRSNVVPADCTAEVDLRFMDPIGAEEMCGRLENLKAYDPDVEMVVSGGINRPAFDKNDGITRLFEHAKGLAAEIGFELEECETSGGVSDGNFTAALGVPTLDGLGVDGNGAHTNHEHFYYSSLEPRAQLMIRLLETLE